MVERISTAPIPNQLRIPANEGLKADEKEQDKNYVLPKQIDDNQVKQNDQQKRQKVEEVVKSLNEFLKPAHTSLKFKLHEKLNEYYVTLINDDTNEVIREIPPKKMLDMYADVAKRLGIIVDKKV